MRCEHFDVNAVDYLLKPFDRSRVEQAVERVKARIAGGPSATPETQIDALLKLLHRPQAAPQPAKLIVQAQSRLLLIDQADICYAAIDEGVIRVVTQNFEGHSKCRTLEDLLDLLDPATFWRAHRGYVVNINHIREVVPWFKSSYQLRMNDKKQTEIPVSRAQTQKAARVVQPLARLSIFAAAVAANPPISRIETTAEAARMSAVRQALPDASTLIGGYRRVRSCSAFPAAQTT